MSKTVELSKEGKIDGTASRALYVVAGMDGVFMHMKRDGRQGLKCGDGNTLAVTANGAGDKLIELRRSKDVETELREWAKRLDADKEQQGEEEEQAAGTDERRGTPAQPR